MLKSSIALNCVSCIVLHCVVFYCIVLFLLYRIVLHYFIVSYCVALFYCMLLFYMYRIVLHYFLYCIVFIVSYCNQTAGITRVINFNKLTDCEILQFGTNNQTAGITRGIKINISCAVLSKNLKEHKINFLFALPCRILSLGLGQVPLRKFSVTGYQLCKIRSMFCTADSFYFHKLFIVFTCTHVLYL